MRVCAFLCACAQAEVHVCVRECCLYQLFKLTNGHRPPGVLANYKRAHCGAKQGQFSPRASLLTPITPCDKSGPKTESSPQVGFAASSQPKQTIPKCHRPRVGVCVCVSACARVCLLHTYGTNKRCFLQHLSKVIFPQCLYLHFLNMGKGSDGPT